MDDYGATSGFDFFQIALDRSADTVLCEQRILSAWVHETLLTPQSKAQPVPVADFPPHMLHKHKEVA